MTAKQLNQRIRNGRARIEQILPELTRAYESVFRAAGRRAAETFRGRALKLTLTAAASPEWAPPDSDELLPSGVLVESAEKRTRAARRKALAAFGAEAADELGIAWDVRSPVLAPLLEGLEGLLSESMAALKTEISATVAANYEAGASVPETATAIIAKVDSLASYQAAAIARTDLNALANGGSLQLAKAVAVATTEAGESGAPRYKTWLSAGDDLVRESHEDANGTSVPLDQPFKVGEGLLQHPGDPFGPPEEVYNCFPESAKVTFPALRAASKRWYAGDLVRIRTASGHELSATPNHPILRSDGVWTAMGEIKEGDDLVSASRIWNYFGAPDPQDPPSEIGQIYGLLEESSVPKGIGGAPPDFHGDGMDGEINVVSVDGSLLVDDQTASEQQVCKFGLSLASAARAALGSRDGSSLSPVRSSSSDNRRSVLASGDVGGHKQLSALIGGHARHAQSVGFGRRTYGKAQGSQPSGNSAATYIEIERDGLDALAVSVTTDKVVQVDRYAFEGHVYNLDTGRGWYIAESIPVRNCRCTLLYEETPMTALAAAAVDNSTGTMVAVYPDPGEARRLAQPGGQPWADLHVTLAFFPDGVDAPLVTGILDRLAAQYGPLVGQVGGVGRFGEGEAGVPIFAVPSVDGLNELRADLARELDTALAEYERDRGFAPHITLLYGSAEDSLPESVIGESLSFTSVSLVRGRDRHDYLLSGVTVSPEEEPLQEGDPVVSNDARYALTADGKRRWRATLMAEDSPTPDGRMIAAGAIEWRDTPLPLMFTDETSEGHSGSVLVGRIDRVDMIDGSWVGEGILDDDAIGEEAARLIDENMLNTVSADLVAQEVELRDARDPFGPAIEPGTEAEDLQPLFVVTRATGLGATIVPMQAIDEARDLVLLAAGGVSVRIPLPFIYLDAEPLAAAACAPEIPPAEWFEDPKLDRLTPLTVTEDGRVYGHFADWNGCHTGFRNQCIRPPRSQIGYAAFLRRPFLTTGGEIEAGQITLPSPRVREGHPDMKLSWDRAVRRYEDRGIMAARVRVGEDRFGPWVAGALSVDLTDAELRLLKGSDLSGDWRTVNGHPRELIGILAGVNVPGYPILVPEARVALAASGSEEVVALVAAGSFSREDCGCDEIDAAELARSAEVQAARSRGVEALAELSRSR